MTPLARLLRPLVRLAIRAGITFPVLEDLLRGLFVDVAQNDILPDTKSRTDSRISLLSGVHRKEIRRLRLAPQALLETPPIVTIASQIIALWLGRAPWMDADGYPRPLPRGDAETSFDSLVESVTKDMRPRAILDSWLADGIVTVDADDHICLNQAAFVPAPGQAAQLFYFGRNLGDHIAAASANITAPGVPPFLDRSLHYDRLPHDVADKLAEIGRVAAQKMLLEVNRAALRLTEGTDQPNQPTRRVNLGVYLFIDDDTGPGPTP
ncbi:MAG: hypothetical protein H7251_08175 [Acetobacteraceae bacterium]|nr:hypothetical protein [Acetobacteraceae bacterium]